MTTEVASPNIAKIHLTERAAKKIRALLEKESVSPDVGGLRVGVQGGGCSGLSYAMRLDTQARDRDKIFEEFGARIFVDPKSFLYLNGTTLEYEETLMRQGFVFQNPNAARNCGCGSSFTALRLPKRAPVIPSLPATGRRSEGPAFLWCLEFAFCFSTGDMWASLTSGWQPHSPATFFVPTNGGSDVGFAGGPSRSPYFGWVLDSRERSHHHRMVP
jgi:iron-sulfur cluster assembly protein